MLGIKAIEIIQGMKVIDFFTEAHRALELLEDYHSKLIKPQDKQLRLAIERVIRIFKSRLFQALLGKYKQIITKCNLKTINFHKYVEY